MIVAVVEWSWKEMTFPNYLRFGWSINSWLWFFLIIIVLKKPELIDKSVEYATPFFSKYPITIFIFMLIIIFDMFMNLITQQMYMQKNINKPWAIKIPKFWTKDFWTFNINDKDT